MSELKLPHCAGPRNYVIAARASAIVLAAEGHLEEAVELQDTAKQLETYIAHHRIDEEDLDAVLAQASNSKGEQHE